VTIIVCGDYIYLHFFYFIENLASKSIGLPRAASGIILNSVCLIDYTYIGNKIKIITRLILILITLGLLIMIIPHFPTNFHLHSRIGIYNAFEDESSGMTAN